MIHVALERHDDFEEWRTQARLLIGGRLPPDAVSWSVADVPDDLFATAAPTPSRNSAPVRASPAFVQLAQSVALHREQERYALLYRLLWRLQDQPRLMDDQSDRDVQRAHHLEKAVRRDIHKMRAFVRFRRLDSLAESGEHYAAWFEPDHYIARANASFFVRRFATMNWTIVTPDASLIWDRRQLFEGSGGQRSDVPAEDAIEELWRDYYRAIFNPARLKVKAMMKEMPRRYWANMPETRIIPDLIAGAQAREVAMITQGGAAPAAAPATFDALRHAVATCQRCPIHADATQAVHGEGPTDAVLMVIGEQPGDHEDVAGRPFVGPAGTLLNHSLAQAGIDHSGAYVTNAVRHFKHERQGKVRLHKTPTAKEIDHCRWWLDSERAIVKPRVILALGASAARAVLGRTDSITRLRERPVTLQDGTIICTTVHPSYLLRIDAAQRPDAERQFVADLKRCRDLVLAHAGK